MKTPVEFGISCRESCLFGKSDRAECLGVEALGIRVL